MSPTKRIDDSIPFLFKTLEDRRKEALPNAAAQRWKDASYYFFFNNGLWTKDEISRFLRAQSFSTLDNIATAFDMEAVDISSQKRRKEGPSPQEVREDVVEAIILSITK